MSDSIPAQRFGPTSGVVTGVLGLVVCLAGSVIVLIDEVAVVQIRIVLALLVMSVLLWAYMLRPRIIIEAGGGTLLLRNAFVDWRIPLAQIKVVGVRVVTTVKTIDDGRYDGIAVGKPLRKIIRAGRPPGMDMGNLAFGGRMPDVPEPSTQHQARLADQSVPDFMTERILHLAQRARDLNLPDGPAVRLHALPELVALGVLLAAFAVSLAF